MRVGTRVAIAAALIVASIPAAAQQPALMQELVRDVDRVETKLVGLAREMPEATLAWRPSDGVRSSNEVLLHVASDNYLLPSFVGTPVPAATGISGTDFATLTRYEKQPLTRDQTIAAMQESFAHLRAAMNATTAARLAEQVSFFGQEMTVREVWLVTALHLHEHLGQMIAYARSNNVTPPWSRAAQ